MMGHGWNEVGWGGWGPWAGPGVIGFLVSAALWSGILAAQAVSIFLLARQLGGQPRLAQVEEMPLSEIRRRVALGEITTDEYDEIVHRSQVKVRSTD